MDIISQTQDGAFWHFKVGGLATDGIYRVADLSRETTNPADWLAANGAEAQNAIDMGGVTLEESNRVVASTAAQSESEVWFGANAGALALFNLPMATLESEVAALCDALFPSATASNKTKLKRLLMAGAVLDRAQVKKEGLG